ncbi:MAG: efflux transporter outer membrane subunit [Deltaproteobacteria bacterium]|nr:efflux transporter outer membrane subunit [Deltaproteobacteria bacterium]
MRRLVMLLGVLLLAGCTLAPKYNRAPGDVPQEYRFQSLQGQPQPGFNTLADLAWWEIFDDRELQGLIRTALEQNYNVLLAAARVAEARALVGVSRSLWLPQVGGTYLFQRQRLSQVSFPPLGPTPPTGNINQLNLDLFWEIDLFGRLRSLTEAARAEFFASEWARRAVFSAVVADVAQAYFELRTLDQQLEISQATLKSYEASRRLVVMRFERGVVSRQDVAQVDALVHTAGAKIPDLRRQIAQKENQICILLGINPQPITRGRPLPDLVVRATVPAGLPSDLLERRPDIRQAEEVLVAANYRIGAARAEFFPRISLTGLFGRQSLALSDLFTGPAKIWSIGPTVTLPIFTSGRNYFNLQATKALKEQTLVLYQFTVRQAFREVADGLIAHAEFREFRKEQAALVKSYQDYSQLANLRYKGGIDSYLAVLDADRQLFSAQLDLATVQRDQLLTLVQLYKSLGGGWETQDSPQGAATPASGPANHSGK